MNFEKPIIKIAIADDHVAIRAGLTELFTTETDTIEVLFAASDGLELLETLRQYSELPDVVLMDIEMPRMGGIEATINIKNLYPEIKVIFMSSFNHQSYIESAIRVGANAYLTKDVDFDDMVEAIKQVHQESVFFNRHMSQELFETVIKDTFKRHHLLKNEILTERDYEFIKLICEQKSDKEIAEILLISISSANTYRKRIMQKLGVNKTIGIVIYAYKNRLVVS